MQYRKLGRSGLEVSAISMGCWALAGGGTWGPQDENDAIAAVKTACDVGINFFDTAEAYGDGRSEEILGRALKGRRHDVVIASKVSASNLSPADLKKACENSLRRLKTDYIDVYYIHWPGRGIPIQDTLGAMEELREEGKIEVAACSNFGTADLQELLKHGRVEANQLPYSLLWRAIEFEIQPLCVDHEIGITCYSPLAQGLLTGKFASADEVPEGRARTRLFSTQRAQARHGEKGAEKETFAIVDLVREVSAETGIGMSQIALAWLLTRPGVASVIAGARNPEQVRANAGAADVDLPAATVDKLTRETEELKQMMGTNPDMWQSDSRYR